jgi:hypothetical protein
MHNQVGFGDGSSYLIGVGLETGEIELCRWQPDGQHQLIWLLDNQAAHHATIDRIAFR